MLGNILHGAQGTLPCTTPVRYYLRQEPGAVIPHGRDHRRWGMPVAGIPTATGERGYDRN